MSECNICPVTGDTVEEERVSFVTHMIGFVLSIIGFIFLTTYACLYGNTLTILSSSIYGVCLVLLYAASTFYHGCQKVQKKSTLQIFDYSCIYLLIAGTYTPFTLGPLLEDGGIYLLSVEWGIAFVGILLKIFTADRFIIPSLISYLVMGWLVVFNLPTLIELLPVLTLAWVAIGGFLYSFGTIFFLWDSLHMNHAIWHIFVLGGSIFHYFAVFDLVRSA